MANQKISALSSGNPAASSDELVIARSGANYKVTAASLAALRLPAGSTTQVQYNLSGAFAGSANMTFSGSTLTLGVAGTAAGALALKGSTSGTATLQTAAAAGTVTVTLQRGETVILIKGVPAQICDNCGEYYLEDGVAERVYGLGEDAAGRRAEVEIVRYAA